MSNIYGRFMGGRGSQSEYRYPQDHWNDYLGPSNTLSAGPSRYQDVAFGHVPPPNVPYHSSDLSHRQRKIQQIDLRNHTTEKEMQLGEHAKNIVRVLQLKNAITHLKEIVDIYSEVESSTGEIWGAYAGEYCKDIENAIHMVTEAADDINRTRKHGKLRGSSSIRAMLMVCYGLRQSVDSWRQACAKNKREYGNSKQDEFLHMGHMANSRRFLNDVKSGLRSWKTGVTDAVETWLGEANKSLSDTQSSIASLPAKSKRMSRNGRGESWY